MLGEKTNTCDRCGDEYDSYMVFVRDNFSDIVGHVSTNQKWDNLCKPCRMAVTDYGAYLTESEQEELEPKTHTDEGEPLPMSRWDDPRE